MRQSPNLRPDLPFTSSLLKSAVQKAVRRGDVDKALACTKSLIDKDPKGCLRRLMVIVLEDGLAHPDLPKLAVLTDRVKQGLVLTDADKSLVLTIVADVTRCEWRDFEKDNPDYSADYKMQKITGEELDLVNAINYRIRLGGWQDDLDLMRTLAKAWNKRFAEGSWNIAKLRGYFTGEQVEYADVPYATIHDIPIEAADFHAFPIAKVLLKKPYVAEMIRTSIPPETRVWAEPWTSDDDILNKVCWTLRSGVNFKKVLWTGEPVNWLEADWIPQQHWHDFREIYSRIKGDLDGLGRWFLEKADK